MRTLAGPIAAFFVLVPAVAATRSADISGDWNLTLNTRQPTHWKATFKQDGETLSGEIRMGASRTAAVKELTGTVKERRIEFGFVVEDLDGDRPYKMAGQIEGDTIQGEKTSFWSLGDADWTATRATDAGDSAAASGDDFRVFYSPDGRGSTSSPARRGIDGVVEIVRR